MANNGGKQNSKEVLENTNKVCTGPHPQCLMGPVDDTWAAVEAFAQKHKIDLNIAFQIFILNELRTIHWGIDEVLERFINMMNSKPPKEV